MSNVVTFNVSGKVAYTQTASNLIADLIKTGLAQRVPATPNPASMKGAIRQVAKQTNLNIKFEGDTLTGDVSMWYQSEINRLQREADRCQGLSQTEGDLSYMAAKRRLDESNSLEERYIKLFC